MNIPNIPSSSRENPPFISLSEDIAQGEDPFPLHLALLNSRCTALLEELNLTSASLSIVLMSDAEMRYYNEEYRKRSGPTNVLSFPTREGPGPDFSLEQKTVDEMPIHATIDALEKELGDVLISLDTATREAQNQQCTLHHRLTELMIHGILHLIGYDHERSEQEALAMWDFEKELLPKIIETARRAQMPYLSINVDHVATLREARGTTEPDPVTAAALCELAGADGIVIHLREDRRHIQDRDVCLMRQTVKTRLNLEMALAKDIVDLALKVEPDMITLVPEKRKELTTEGGLDVCSQEKKLKKTIKKFTEAGIPVSLFIDPDAEQIESAHEVGATFIELHTGRYCDATSQEEQDYEFRLIAQSAELAHEIGLRVNAGHGLDYRNVARIAALPTIEELSIGHAVMSRAILVGMDQAVREMLALVKGK